MLELGKGAADGVRPHMVVLSPDGVLGQVLGVTPHTARVLLLTDSQSGIGAMTERTHAVGVLKGSNDGSCHLYYLSGQEDVHAGDNVVTSGLSLIFPPGLPLGRVTAVTRNPSISSRIATVQTAADPADTRLVIVMK
jgi:rod shape-determining protein MreC